MISYSRDLGQADLCVPRLNEGDQVVLINGRDISDYTHDDVVMLIKASCENQSAELILLVRPNGKELYIHGHILYIQHCRIVNSDWPEGVDSFHVKL